MQCLTVSEVVPNAQPASGQHDLSHAYSYSDGLFRSPSACSCCRSVMAYQNAGVDMLICIQLILPAITMDRLQKYQGEHGSMRIHVNKNFEKILRKF